VNINKY